MSETYAARLQSIAQAVPEEPCVLALVPTIAESHAAGLASDLAQAIARGRKGHTLLFSLESGRARLDHEIGVEGGMGLTDVMEGRVPLARAAASGRARGFIYVPAGRAPRDGTRLVRSAAWRSLVESAVDRRGTVLVFAPREVLEAAHGSADEPPARFEGVVWLGLPPSPPPALPWPILGSVPLPGGGPPSPDREAGGAPARPPIPGPAGSARPAVSDAPPLVGAGRRRPRGARERRRRGWLPAALLIAILAAVALVAVALLRGESGEPFLPQNDSLWRTPVRPDSSAP